MIRVAIRFDDPSRNSCRQVEHGLIVALKQHGLSATFAVIPYTLMAEELVPLTLDAVPHLRDAADAGIIEIAQHGFCHRWRGTGDQAAPSEFAGMPPDIQLEMLVAGRKQLGLVFGRVPVGFVPPWNNYDGHTLASLESLDYSYLSAGWSKNLSKKMAMLPRTCGIFDLPINVAALRTAGLEGTVIGVMHHYDFVEDPGSDAKRNLADFDSLLTWLKGQNDIQVMSLGQLASELPPSDWLRAQRIRNILMKLPWRFQHRLLLGCLLTVPPWRAVLAELLG